MRTVEELFQEQIKDLYSAESQLTKALPKMAEAANHPELRQAFTTHLAETENQMERLKQVAALGGFDPGGKTCEGMQGCVKEGKEAMSGSGDPKVNDIALIVAAQRVEHYEIAGYGNARYLAELLGFQEAATLLRRTEEEEERTDKLLTSLCQNQIAPSAPLGERVAR